MKKRFPIIILLSSVLLIFGYGCATHPSPEKREVASPSKEMGKAFLSEALKHYQFVKDPEVVGMVNRVGRHIIKGIGANPASYHFFVVRENQPNAFAIPGGYIFIFDGLLLQLRGEEELAGVLAHEVAHVERNHFFKDEKKIAALDIATIAAILLTGGNPAAMTLAGAVNIDMRLQFSRENESEADSYALRYLKEGLYSPEGLLNFFDSLIRYERFNPQAVPAYFSTHPGLGERRDRVANYLRRGPAQPHSGSLSETDILNRIEWGRLIATLTSYGQRWREESSLYQLFRIDDMPEEQREELMNYLSGVAYMKTGRFNDAILKYKAALELNGESAVYYADLAYCYLKQQDLAGARNAALQSRRLRGDYAPTHVILGMLELDSDNPDEAIVHLKEALRINREDPLANFHLAMAYRKSGDATKEAFYSARYFRVNLEPERALGELKRARRLATSDSPLYFRIEREIEEIKREGI